MEENVKVNILLVDDTPHNLIALEAVLNHPLYNLVLATSGREALSCLLREEYAVVLLDVMMPEMDGYEVAAAMKAVEKTRHIPIIFLTAVVKDTRDIFRGYTVGGVDYIQKPLEPEVVRAKVAIFVQLFSQKREIQRQAELICNSERAQSFAREHAARIRAEAAEQRYYDLINWVDHAVLWEYDATSRRFSFVSQRSSEILGYSPTDWIADPQFVESRIPETERAVFSQMLDEGIIQGKDGRCEHRFYKADGTTLWVHSGINPRKDSSGSVTLLWGLTLDITGFKTSEVNQRFLAHASVALSSSLDNEVTLKKLADLVVPTLADRFIVDIVTAEGESKSITIGDEAPKREPLIQAPSESSLLLKVIRSGNPEFLPTVPDTFPVTHAWDNNHLKVQKGLKIYSLMIIPLKINEKVLGAASFASIQIYRRFTENDLKLSEELARHISISIENSRIYEEAKKAIVLREEVLGIVSHDLKSPLTAIGVSAQLIMRGRQTDVKKIGEKIHRAVGTMSRLISNLLDLSKIEAGRLSIEKTLLQAQKLIEEILDSMSSVALQNNVSLVSKLPEEPLIFMGDESRVTQVLMNLIGNAIKFTPEKNQITIGAKVRGSEAVFWVTDRGPGIAPDHIPFLFERYWQSEEGIKFKGGSGLGLFIAKKMVEAHHGSIWVESTPGQGSTFFFSVPRLEGNAFPEMGAA